MASALLAKLKVKHTPQIQESVEVQVQPASKQEKVVIKTKIIDGTQTSNKDRQEFIENIQDKLLVHRKRPTLPAPSVDMNQNLNPKNLKNV